MLLTDKQKSGFLRWNLLEDAAKTDGMRQSLDYHINAVDKAAAGTERTDYNTEINSTMGKTLSNSIACYKEFNERKSQSMWQTSLLFYEIATATPIFSNHQPDQSVAINIKVRPSTSKKIDIMKAQRTVSIFVSNKVFFN